MIDSSYRKLKLTFVVGAVLGVLFVWFYLIDPFVFPVLKFNNGVDPLDMQLVKDEYRRGEMVQGYTSFCKKRIASASTSWVLHTDKLTFFAPYDTPRNISKGCFPEDREFLIFDIRKIPEDAMLGEAHFTGKTIHTLVGNRQAEQDYRTATFYIVE